MVTTSAAKRSALMLVALAAAAAAATLALGAAPAQADKLKPSPWVTSPGADSVRKDSTQGVVRDGDILAPAGGEVRQSPIAVPVGPASPFKGAQVGPGLGKW